jgi:PAS domain S-box-containing protein
MAENDLFPAHGDVAALIRSKDWSKTNLGLPETWPASLRTILRLMLTSRYAMWMGWGHELIFFHNDAYAAMSLGEKRTWALGTPATIVWAEIWDTIGPRIDNVLRTGEASWDEGLLLFLERSGYREETYHTFSYSPAPGDDGSASGLFCVVIEETERVIDGRRMALLRELGSLLGQTMTTSEVFATVERCLGNHQRDITFSLTYSFEDEHGTARRVSQTGFDGDHGAAARTFVVGDAEGVWPFESVLAGGAPIVVPLAPGRVWPKGAWDVPPAKALVVPIPHAGRSRPSGVFIAGVNPHRPLDDGFRSFVELFVGQVAAALSNAAAYEEAKQRADALAEIDRAKTAFFSNVSHEFRTPLTLMLGPTQDALAIPGGVLAGPELEMVYRNELRLLKLVNALLDFARIEAGRTQAAYERTDLASFTADLASSFRSAIDRAGLRFEVDCRTLPEPTFVDHGMWEKIVLNLLSNALKFTFDGAISVKVAWRGDHAELTVADSGVGIAATELPRLFERFRRIEGVRARTHEGSGIGLALVHDLVRLHGGTIEVASEVDRGTTFTVKIPAGTAHLPQESIVAAHEHPTGHASAAYLEEALRWTEALPTASAAEETTPTSARILVADDNADMREYVARVLRQHWTVDAVADGAAALETIRAKRPDLVVSDVMMPHLDGFGLIRELRADPSTAMTPILLLSARAGEEATAEGLRAGANDYLVKPFSASSLLVRVEAQLSAARLRDAIRRSADEERERLRTIFQSSPAAIAILRGPDLRIELANPLILDLWGKTNAVVGKPLLEGVPELRGQGFDDLLLEVLATGEAHVGKEVLARVDRDRDGVPEDLYCDYVYAPLPGPEGRTDGIFVHAYDVTDKVRARGHLDQLRQDAEAANRLKDEFLATMSHELRTPLNAILGWASMLRSGGMDKPAVDRALATIERNAKAQARLIEDILDVSRIISGKLRLDVRRVDMNAIARAAVDVLRPAADAKGVRFVVDFASPSGLELSGDPDRLQQVVWNLLSNAVKFTPPGGAVSVHVEPRDGFACIVVRDTGPGIQPEHLHYIFERFRQVDSTTTRRHGGLGLGLAIVRHLVELHGGTVAAESGGAGAGAMFTVALPMRAVREVGEPLVPSEEPPSVTASPAWGSLAGVRVLVVDDEEDARLLVTTALERGGARVHAVENAVDAFAVLAKERIDVLVSDVGMPDEDGFSLIQRVRALPSGHGGDVRAIALTAYARAEDASKALRLGFQLHLAKPIDLHELTNAVSLLVSERARAS